MQTRNHCLRAFLPFVLCVFLLIPGSLCTAQEIPHTQAAISRLMETYVAEDRFNGCLLVAHHHEIIYTSVHGIANPATGEALTRNHRFRLASVSKQLCAVGVMVLKDRGKLRLSDDIRAFLPDLPYPGITIRHVLTHTSGLPDYGELLERYWDTGAEDSARRKIVGNQDVYRLLVSYHPPVAFQPGERYAYCNTGYNLLALVIEQVAGMPFPEFMRTQVFLPAGMTHTFVNAADGSLPIRLRARGFKSTAADPGYLLTDSHYQNGLYGDGGIYTTIDDMYAYDQALHSGKLVNKKTLLEAYAPAKLNNGTTHDYGFGWSIISFPHGDVLAHGGGWAGFSAFMLRDRHSGDMIIQLTNRPGIRRGELVFAVYDILRQQRQDK